VLAWACGDAASARSTGDDHRVQFVTFGDDVHIRGWSMHDIAPGEIARGDSSILSLKWP